MRQIKQQTISSQFLKDEISFTLRIVCEDTYPQLQQDVRLQGLLSVSEFKYYKNIKNSSRKRTWLRSRLLLKELIKDYHFRLKGLQTSFSDIEVIYTKDGQPILRNPNNYHVSVSHSGSFIMVAITLDKKIGVDVQKNIKLTDNKMDIFLDPIEKRKFKTNPIAVWTIKEAYLKSIGTGLKRSLKSIVVDYNDKLFTLNDLVTNKTYPVISNNYGGYSYAVCVV